MESNVSFTFNKEHILLYNKDIENIEGINPIWNILSREGKKEVIGSFIKFIDVSIDNNYNVKIENINFNNDFLQNKFYNISGYLLDKFKDKYKNIKYLGMCTKNDIDKKKKLNNKIIIKSKNQLLDNNKKLLEENESLRRENYSYKTKYNELKEKNDYLIYHLNKIIKKLPEFIQNIIDRLFNYNNIELKFFKQQYDPEVKKIERKNFESRRISNLFNKKEINKSLKQINEDMEKSAEEFYMTNKEKDDNFEL